MPTELEVVEEMPGYDAAAIAKLRFFVPRAVLTVGEHARLIVAAEDAAGTEVPGVAVRWSSSAPGTVSVDADGVVEALATGEARIIATAGTVSAELGVIASRVSVRAFGVHPSRASLCVGESARIEVDVTDHRGLSRDPRIVAWSSSDPSIARVTPDGRVTAIGHGQAKITAANGTLNASATVEVVPLVAANLTVSPPALTLEIGAAEQLKATVLSQRQTVMPDAVLRWQSSDPKIVWVDDAGAVRGVAAGVAKIRVSCGSFFATSTIRVPARRP
ncbi:MAG: Ig-like domain-containing protein [Gemmatimonadota bacterium]|nr:Ig-like domain-containing protein [Gemmatimonadota bacterium]